MHTTTILGFALLCLAACCIVGHALPQDGVLTDDAQEDPLRSVFDPLAEADRAVEPAEEHHRQRRATCLPHACRAKCILRGRRGGYCNFRKLCVCRN